MHATAEGARENFIYLERVVKFLLWSRGAHRVHFAGPVDLGTRLQQHYRESPTGKFDGAAPRRWD